MTAATAHPEGTCEIRPDMLFREAHEAYIRSRMLLGAESMVRGPHYVRPTTLNNYRQNVKSLGLFFGGRLLSDIHPDHIGKSAAG